MARAIVDTGPLVALLDRAERRHGWVSDQLTALDAPLLTCEAVITEGLHLLARFAGAQDAVMALIHNGALGVPFRLNEHVEEVRGLMRKYADRPMSFADACLVRMAEVHEHHAVLTLDSDFQVYRKNGHTPLNVIRPG